MPAPAALKLFAPSGMPEVEAGADLGALIVASVRLEGGELLDGDVVVLAQKIVSKAQGRLVNLADITPSRRAVELAAACDKDPRLVELILSEAQDVMRVRKGVLIVRHRLGLVLANAGIDQSNIDHGGQERALLLPVDPDAACRTIRAQVQALAGVTVSVVIIDSLGRAWRNGTVGTAIGVAGMPALIDLRGREDRFGRRLQTSELGFADEVAAAASILMGQAGEGRPIVIVRGLVRLDADGAAADLVRRRDLDLFP